MPDYKYQIILDLNIDAWNWYEGCNTVSHGVDWKRRIDPAIYDHIYNVDQETAYEYLIPFLRKKYKKEEKSINDYIKYINSEFEDKFTLACLKVAELTGRPIYRNDFTIYLTTFPRCPYNYFNGSIWNNIGLDDPIKNFMDELSHLQLFHYWRNNKNSSVSRLSSGQYAFLKESLTVIFDADLKPLIDTPVASYKIHREFRKLLHTFWEESHDFNKLVNYGLKNLPSYYKL